MVVDATGPITIKVIPSGDGGEEFPWWILLAGMGLVAMGGFYLAKGRKTSKKKHR